MKFLFLPLAVLLLCHCGSGAKSGPHHGRPFPGLHHPGGGFGGTSVARSPAVINVSGWDPKEVQRSGDRYSRHDVSALRRNGALGLIARSAKGPLLDEKFGDFLKAADREGMLIGAYHYVTLDQDPAYQAENFVKRVRATARSRGISRQKILLVGDFDSGSTPDRIIRFNDRVEQLSGVIPVVYLENSPGLRARLSAATPDQKARIRRAPYWLALYGPGGTERAMSGAGDLTPDRLTREYGVWRSWSMWQYGGVVWEGGRSNPRHYNTPAWRSPAYFGTLAHPAERNVFKGGTAELRAFWDRHSFAWW